MGWNHESRFRWESVMPVWGAASGGGRGLEWGAQTSGERWWSLDRRWVRVRGEEGGIESWSRV